MILFVRKNKLCGNVSFCLIFCTIATYKNKYASPGKIRTKSTNIYLLCVLDVYRLFFFTLHHKGNWYAHITNHSLLSQNILLYFLNDKNPHLKDKINFTFVCKLCDCNKFTLLPRLRYI